MRTLILGFILLVMLSGCVGEIVYTAGDAVVGGSEGQMTLPASTQITDIIATAEPAVQVEPATVYGKAKSWLESKAAVFSKQTAGYMAAILVVVLLMAYMIRRRLKGKTVCY